MVSSVSFDGSLYAFVVLVGERFHTPRVVQCNDLPAGSREHADPRLPTGQLRTARGRSMYLPGLASLARLAATHASGDRQGVMARKKPTAASCCVLRVVIVAP